MKGSIEIVPDEPIGTISPEIQGHFIEHIGGVIYDGIWVGEESPVANIGGIRRSLVESMRRIRPPVVRWPGGCFADSYNWRDGIGPRERRPRRTNFWISHGLRDAPDGPQKYEPNHFGTHEFMRFCRLIGAQPYLAVNLRSLTPLDFDDWVEYCNAPAGRTTLSDARAAAGDTAPFTVRLWGVGNEAWGCGGRFTPEEYAKEFARFTAWVPDYGAPLSFIGSGPNGGDVGWTRRFFTHLAGRDPGGLARLSGWAMHYYCGTAGKGQAVDFTDDDWYELLSKAVQMEPLILESWAAMAETDPRHRVKLVVDEWGTWHRAGTEVDPTYLFCQMSTMRDALVAALTLDIFNRHADKVSMANVAQLVNNLHSLFLARGEKLVATPNFHVFDMYCAHQGGSSLRTVFSADPVATRRGGTVTLPGLAGSASIREKALVLTVVNPHVSEEREAQIVVRGLRIESGTGRVLRAADIHGHNSFDSPRAVEPRDVPVRGAGPTLVHQFPPASITCLHLRVG